MSLDIQILKGLLDKDVYTKYRHLINVPDQLKKHYTLLDKLHEMVDISITEEEYALYMEQEGLLYQDIYVKASIDKGMLLELIRTHSERVWAEKQAIILLEVVEGRRKLSDALEHYSEWTDKPQDETEEFVTDDVEQLWEEVRRDGGLRWRLSWLNDTIGGLRKGNFGFVFARTNAGKTTFLCSEVSHFLEQAEKPILWINNEEPGSRIKFRMLQSFFGIDEQTLNSDRAGWMKKFLTNTNSLFKLKDSGVVHKRDVERLVKTLEPELLIIDNIDKVHGFKGDRQDLMLGSIYVWAREIAKEYCPIIGVSQANGGAENKKWLTHNEIESAHTAKSKDADFIIGIGHTYDVGMEHIRYLRQVKNKFMAGDHKLTCKINYDIGRYEEL